MLHLVGLNQITTFVPRLSELTDFCASYLADKLAMGCPYPSHEFVCCKELAIKAGVLTGIECAFLVDLQRSWASIGGDIQ